MDLWYLIVFLAVFAFITSWIAFKTNLIRDNINDIQRFRMIANAIQKNDAKSPFSLAKAQVAFWTIIILSSFLALYVNNKKASLVPQLTNVTIILLGISIGTTTVGKIIDDSQKDNIRHQNTPSKGLLIDILSDDKGVSIHRLQNVIWNVVVGFIFLRFVFVEKAFPGHEVISDQLLALMGISSGAYLGIKVTENNKNISDPGITEPVLNPDDIPDPYAKTKIIASPEILDKKIPQDGLIHQKKQ